MKLPVITYLGNSLMFTFSSIWLAAFNFFFIFSRPCCTFCGHKLNYIMLQTEGGSRASPSSPGTRGRRPVGQHEVAGACWASRRAARPLQSSLWLFPIVWGAQGDLLTLLTSILGEKSWAAATASPAARPNVSGAVKLALGPWAKFLSWI